MGENIRTGEKVTLVSLASDDTSIFKERFTHSATASMAELINKQFNISGQFIAVSEPPTEMFPTLPSIRWEKDVAVYLGPVTVLKP